MKYLIHGLLDKKYKQNEEIVSTSKYFLPAEMHRIKFRKNGIASAVTARYYMGLNADCDNLIIVVIDE